MLLSHRSTRSVARAATSARRPVAPIAPAFRRSLPRPHVKRDTTAKVAELSRPIKIKDDPIKIKDEFSAEISDMFCYQCEQTRNHTGCASQVGVCGKTEEGESSSVVAGARPPCGTRHKQLTQLIPTKTTQQQIKKVANLQDLLVYQLKGLAAWARHAHTRAAPTRPPTRS